MTVKIREPHVELLKNQALEIKRVSQFATSTKDIHLVTMSDEKDDDELRAEHIRELNKKVSRRNKIITSLAAGAIAGAVAKTTIAPLDRTKINFQISSEKQYSFRKAVKFLIKTVKTDGFFALWRGNSATMARIIPYAAFQYAAHEQWKYILSNGHTNGHLPPGKRYLSGSLAGVTASSLTYPLDMARARMAVTKRNTYKGIGDVFRKIHQTEGLKVMYRGYIPTMLGVIPYAGTSFFTYETLKISYLDYNEGREPPGFYRLCFGAVAGLLGQTSSYPLDIVRRRMQTAGVTGNADIYSSISGTIRYVVANEGVIKGLYKGLSMNWIKGPIAVGISFASFDILQRHLRKLPFFHEEE